MTAEPKEDRPRRRFSLLLLPFWWATLLLALLLLICYAGTYISPARFWPVALVCTAYPYLLVANLIALAFWLMVRRRRALPPLLAILLGWGYVGEHVQLAGSSTVPAHSGEAFKVMSWNVRIFDLYNWSNNSTTRASMLALLAEEQPAILCTQEFLDTRDPKHYHMRPDTLKKALGVRHHHAEYTQHSRPGFHFGIATFSKYPIVARGSLQFPDDLNNLCIWSDIVVGSDTLRVYNAHLASLRFGNMDYRFMKSLETGGARDSLSIAGPRIIGRMKNAFIRRATETETIVRHMRKSPHPVLWCGDLNDTPMSYSYQLLRREGLTDAFMTSGQGFGVTYIGSFPRFRIDHMLHAPRLVTWDFHTLDVDHSDHRPISAQVAFAPR